MHGSNIFQIIRYPKFWRAERNSLDDFCILKSLIINERIGECRSSGWAEGLSPARRWCTRISKKQKDINVH